MQLIDLYYQAYKNFIKESNKSSESQISLGSKWKAYAFWKKKARSFLYLQYFYLYFCIFL